MIRTKKIAVYYRDIPASLDTLVFTDPDLKMAKDGIFSCDGIKCPRATITMLWEGSDTDKIKLKKIERLLEELSSNNQIISFSIR